MIGEIIAIGDELTSGRITNTTSGYAARALFLLGHEIQAMHTIGDAPELIGKTLQEALARGVVVLDGAVGAVHRHPQARADQSDFSIGGFHLPLDGRPRSLGDDIVRAAGEVGSGRIAGADDGIGTNLDPQHAHPHVEPDAIGLLMDAGHRIQRIPLGASSAGEQGNQKPWQA